MVTTFGEVGEQILRDDLIKLVDARDRRGQVRQRRRPQRGVARRGAGVDGEAGAQRVSAVDLRGGDAVVVTRGGG